MLNEMEKNRITDAIAKLIYESNRIAQLIENFIANVDIIEDEERNLLCKLLQSQRFTISSLKRQLDEVQEIKTQEK